MEQMNFIIYNSSNKKLFEKLKKSKILKKITVTEFFSNLENNRINTINNYSYITIIKYCTVFRYSYYVNLNIIQRMISTLFKIILYFMLI